MRMKIKKWLAAFTVAAGMVLPATTAFAFTDEAAQQAVEAPAPTETPVQEEEPPKTEETPFSVPGNGSLADDKSGDSTKEFLTVQTKNGNTFFLVLDRSSNKENVYMLSMIDEDDLAEFVTETKKQETEQPTVITPQPETKPAVEETEKEPEKESEGFIRTLDVYLRLSEGMQGLDRDEFVVDLDSELRRLSPETYNYRVFINS